MTSFVRGLLFADVGHKFAVEKFISKTRQSHQDETSVLQSRIHFFSWDRINNKRSSSLTDQNKVPTVAVMKYVYWKLCKETPKYSKLHKYKCWFAIFLPFLSLNNLNEVYFA